jgi:hypothetical protein
LFTRIFWTQTLERAVKTAAQALIGMWALGRFDVLHADWPLAAGVAGGAAVLSVLTSLISAPFAEPDSPSLVPTTPEQWPHPSAEEEDQPW